jgi:hypothetical protein
MLKVLLRITLTFGLIFAGFVTTSPQVLRAQEVVMGETTVLVPANEQVTIGFETFCLDFGLEFPSEIGAPIDRAQDEVLAVLRIAIEEGYTQSDPLQVQLAIWRVIEGEWPFDEEEVPRELAEEILAAAEEGDTDPLIGEGISLTQAVDDGLVSVESEDFNAVDAPTPGDYEFPYKGQGTLIITNLTDEDIQIYFPYGTVFMPGPESEQDIVAYAIDMELIEQDLVQVPEQETPTPTPTPVPDTPTPTPTPVPDTPTPTPVPDTPTPTPTPVPDTPTPTPVPDTPTPTPVPDTPTPTPVPDTPTPTPVPDTPTPVPDTPTPSPTPTETPLPAPDGLPVTGASMPPGSSGNSLMLIATLFALGAIAGGWLLWTRRRSLG